MNCSVVVASVMNYKNIRIKNTQEAKVCVNPILSAMNYFVLIHNCFELIHTHAHSYIFKSKTLL